MNKYKLKEYLTTNPTIKKTRVVTHDELGINLDDLENNIIIQVQSKVHQYTLALDNEVREMVKRLAPNYVGIDYYISGDEDEIHYETTNQEDAIIPVTVKEVNNGISIQAEFRVLF